MRAWLIRRLIGGEATDRIRRMLRDERRSKAREAQAWAAQTRLFERDNATDEYDKLSKIIPLFK